MAATGEARHWLDGYSNHHYAWRPETRNGRTCHTRKLGFVESSFDLDGRFYQGRADINALLTLDVQGALETGPLRERILLAWTTLRMYHPLLSAMVPDGEGIVGRSFIIEEPDTASAAIRAAARTITYLDVCPDQSADFYRHLTNTGRVPDTAHEMARLFVFPVGTEGKSNVLKLAAVVCHMASDGLTIYNWFRHLIELLNTSMHTLRGSGLPSALHSGNFSCRLPPAQEDLYPEIPGSKAKRRWFWLLVRILRHVRRPLPVGFRNPLRREKPFEYAVSMPPSYPNVLSYPPTQPPPPVNTFTVSATLSPVASSRFIHLVRSAGVSIGAGCFALVGLALMELHEAWLLYDPGIHRAPFVASFPLNPRAAFGRKASADSCMLAFSDGIVMPFLASDLNVEGRLRLAARIAHRQLKAYRFRTAPGDVHVWLKTHGPMRMMAENYLLTRELMNKKLPAGKLHTPWTDPQGAYPAAFHYSTATCGVSSIGSTQEILSNGKYTLNNASLNDENFVANFKSIITGVRARNDEFLVGCTTDADGVRFTVSFDGNAIDEDKALIWKEKMETLLEKKPVALL